MHVRLDILDGSMRGRTFSFDLPEGEEIRLGRDTERCEVGFSPDYSGVSRQHCALRAVLGRVRLRTNKENAVLLGRQPTWDDTILPGRSVLQLGRGGPRVALRVKYPAGIHHEASTIINLGGVAPEFELQKEAVQVAGELRTHRRGAWISRACIASIAIVGVWFALQARVDAAHLKQAVLDEDQKEVVLQLIEAQANVLPEMADTAARVADSVYCVMKQDDGGATPVGTAWVVDAAAGLLATNAHVAEQFEKEKTFLRSSGGRPADIAIESVRSHPDYEEFKEQLGRYCQVLDISGADSSTRSMRGYDVALLIVAVAERPQLAAGLPLLTSKETVGIGPGSACATIGFPAEGIGFNPQRPQHKTHLGHVVALTDYFMAATTPEYALLVHTSLPVAGGASGSPVVDSRGRVIGLISSASVVHSAEGRRIPLAGSTCAQRVDTLHELLDGHVPDQNRKAVWEENFAAALSNAKKTMEQVLIDSFERVMRRRGAKGKVNVLSRDQIALEWDEKTGATMKTVEVRAPASGTCLCCVIADDAMDIDLTVFLPNGDREEDRSPDWFPSVLFEIQKGETVRIATFREGKKQTGAMILLLQQTP